MSDNKSVQEKFNLENFKLIKILNNNSSRKLICVLGYFKSDADTISTPTTTTIENLDASLSSTNNEKEELDISVELIKKDKFIDAKEKAIIILEKCSFSEKDLQSNNEHCFFNKICNFKDEFVNDIYHNFNCTPNEALNVVKTTVIYPVTEKHIQKYTIQPVYLIQETPEIYKNLVQPHLETEQFSIEWVYNILEHKQEVDRIVFEDPDPEIGFILVPDLKWNRSSRETLYLLALVHKHNIKSLRDLNETHLSLLKNVRDKCIDAIAEKYQLNRSQLRIYIHYQPSFYHFHIHFTYLRFDAPGIFCEKSHLLDTVISNIELMPDYYQRTTLTFVARESDKLYKKYIALTNPKTDNGTAATDKFPDVKITPATGNKGSDTLIDENEIIIKKRRID